MVEELKDIEGAYHIEHDYGERFRGWYFSKIFIEKKTIPLNYKDTDLSYRFSIYDFKYRFIIPSKIEFSKGMIAYTSDERQIGIFRFPRDEKGHFVAPFPAIALEHKIKTLSDKEVMEMLKMEKPLVFEAFRIPMYGFKLFDLSDYDLSEISGITDKDFTTAIRIEHNSLIENRTEEIKNKILSLPNYLLILQNVLDRQWKDLSDLSTATDDIIRI